MLPPHQPLQHADCVFRAMIEAKPSWSMTIAPSFVRLLCPVASTILATPSAGWPQAQLLQSYPLRVQRDKIICKRQLWESGRAVQDRRTSCCAFPAAAALYALLIGLLLRLAGRADVEVLRLALQGKDVLLLLL